MPNTSTPRLLFESVPDLRSTDWTHLPATGDRDAMEFVPSEGYYQSKGDRMRGPALPCVTDPFAYYRLTLTSRFDEPGQYALVFQDKHHRDLPDDIYGQIDPSNDWRQQTFCFRGREAGRTFHLDVMSHGRLDIRRLRIEQISLDTVCAWADDLYASMPPIAPSPGPPEPLHHMTRTQDRLDSGQPLRIVMLGDSIINDTSNSNWDALLRRNHPRARPQILTSVRGSTGCWHYQDAAAFDAYVARFKPDLLMIGGISHKEDLPAIDRVAARAQTQLGCEVLLMSGPMGPDWREHNPGQPDAPRLPPQPYAGDTFNDSLATLAHERGVGFFDMNTAWHQYLGASGQPHGWYHRDPVHANDRGKQILARLMTTLFTPASSDG